MAELGDRLTPRSPAIVEPFIDPNRPAARLYERYCCPTQSYYVGCVLALFAVLSGLVVGVRFSFYEETDDWVYEVFGGTSFLLAIVALPLIMMPSKFCKVLLVNIINYFLRQREIQRPRESDTAGESEGTYSTGSSAQGTGRSRDAPPDRLVLPGSVPTPTPSEYPPNVSSAEPRMIELQRDPTLGRSETRRRREHTTEASIERKDVPQRQAHETSQVVPDRGSLNLASSKDESGEKCEEKSTVEESA